MPKYTKRKLKDKFKHLKSLHQHARFLGGIGEEDWRVFQRAAKLRENHEPHVHSGAYKDVADNGRLAIMHALTAEHTAKARRIRWWWFVGCRPYLNGQRWWRGVWVR